MSEHHPVTTKVLECTWYQLPEPISSINMHEALRGPFNCLRANSVYKLGDDHFLLIMRDNGGAAHDNLSFDLFRRHGKKIELVSREACRGKGEFERRLIAVIDQNGGYLHNASEGEIVNLASHLWDKLEGLSGHTPDQSLDSYALNKMLSREKPLVSEPIALRMQHIAENHISAEMDVLEGISGGGAKATRAESSVARLAREESRFGKTGLIIAGATVLVGAILYANHAMNKNRERER
jgi:hypothetical protein